MCGVRCAVCGVVWCGVWCVWCVVWCVCELIQNRKLEVSIKRTSWVRAWYFSGLALIRVSRALPYWDTLDTSLCPTCSATVRGTFEGGRSVPREARDLGHSAWISRSGVYQLDGGNSGFIRSFAAELLSTIGTATCVIIVFVYVHTDTIEGSGASGDGTTGGGEEADTGAV